MLDESFYEMLDERDLNQGNDDGVVSQYLARFRENWEECASEGTPAVKDSHTGHVRLHVERTLGEDGAKEGGNGENGQRGQKGRFCPGRHERDT